MPISKNLVVPASANLLEFPNDPNATFFIAFISSEDPITKQPWCPGVRAVLPVLNSIFSSSDTPEVALVEVGQRPEYVYVLYVPLPSARFACGR